MPNFVAIFMGVALVFEKAPDQLFVVVRSVGVCGVDKVDPKLGRFMQTTQRSFIVAGAIEFAHSHAAKAKRRDLEIAAKCALFHSFLSFIALQAPRWHFQLRQ